MSMIPIRCFTCGKVLGNKWERFCQYEDKTLAFKEMRIERYCCKRILLTTIDTFEITSQYNTLPDIVSLKLETNTNIIHKAR